MSRVRIRFVCALLTVLMFRPDVIPGASADEGMWLFTDLPTQFLKQQYGFEPTDAWADHLMKSCVRFNIGGSASFVSSNGLVLTNHHVGSDTLHKLSTPERNIMESGFLARTHAEELKAPDLELNQLVNIRDVTAQVQESVTPEMSAEQAVAARRAVIANIEKSALDETGLRSNVITLYGGGRYHLYQYRKYTDVRLVWAPETSVAFFGGDADNFEYPRYCLDACIFRVYENDQPARIDHFLKWSSDGPAENELVFVSGNPGRTNRIYTIDALKYQRDHYLPYVMNYLRRQEILLQQFGLRGTEHARRAREDLFGIQNSRKARLGMLAGLQDPATFAMKQANEAALLKNIQQNPDLQPLADAWNVISQTTAQRTELLGKGVSLNSQIFGFAKTLVEMTEQDEKPSAERFPEYSDAGRESLLQQLLSTAPVYQDLDQVLLADSISRTLELRGADDPLCQAMLSGKNPADRAAELVQASRLHDVQFRRQLAEGGLTAVRSSDDPMIEFAKVVLPEIQRMRAITDQLDEQEKQAYARIAEAQFATQGTSTYPDATFTLRLAFGRVAGYEQDGEQIPAMTTIGGAFEHQQKHAGQADYELPESWEKARPSLNLSTRLNFVCTADIIGGNSGSPVVNEKLELVGLIFDGNIQSLTSNFIYTDQQSRSVSVHSSALKEALQVVYGAHELVEQLGQ